MLLPELPDQVWSLCRTAASLPRKHLQMIIATFDVVYDGMLPAQTRSGAWDMLRGLEVRL